MSHAARQRKLKENALREMAEKLKSEATRLRLESDEIRHRTAALKQTSDLLSQEVASAACPTKPKSCEALLSPNLESGLEFQCREKGASASYVSVRRDRLLRPQK